MKVYGIKNCGSVKKALSFLNDKNIKYEFIDFKKEHVAKEIIEQWLTDIPLDRLFNNKGTKYRTLGLSKQSLNDQEKLDWLECENMLIKRPVITLDNGKHVVAFDLEQYKNIFGEQHG